MYYEKLKGQYLISRKRLGVSGKKLSKFISSHLKQASFTFLTPYSVDAS